MESDSDDDFVTYGTPLEVIEDDEPLPKPVAVHDQVVLDRQGRQRFHGAFTGGFSAGFFNTVGSKEGFTPSTFISSRSKRADKIPQSAENYMDSDDLDQFGIAPRKVVTTDNFKGDEDHTRKRPVTGQGIIPDDGRIQDLIVPIDDTIGTRLLRRMGWKPGQGIGPKLERKRTSKKKQKVKNKSYGCARPPGLGDGDDDDRKSNHDTDDLGESDEVEEEEDDDDDDDDDFMKGFLFAPDDIQDFIFKPKDDIHGIGYRGIDTSRSVLGGHVTLFDEPVISRSGRQGIQGHAFGLGVFEEEEDDVYSSDRLSSYDRVLGGEEETKKEMYGWTGPPSQQTGGHDVLPGFKQAAAKKLSGKVFPPPTLPKDFRPFHQFKPISQDTRSTQPSSFTSSRFTLSADQRASMLGEEPLPGPSSVLQLLSSEDLAKIKAARNQQETPTQPEKHASRWDRGIPKWSSPTLAATAEGASGFKPFNNNPEKQQRYEEYLQNRTHGFQQTSMTEWERQQEQDEFARAASLYRPMARMMASRFVSAKHSDNVGDTVEVPAEDGGDQSDQMKAAEMKMFGQLTRDTLEWHPDKLLCKRFNVADPYPGSTIVGLPTVKKDKFSVFNFLAVQQPENPEMEHQPSLQVQALPLIESPLDSDRTTGTASSKRSRWDKQPGILHMIGAGEDHGVDDNVLHANSREKNNRGQEMTAKQDVAADGDDETRPPLDLFQAIFLESNSSSTDTSSEDEDREDEKLERKTSDSIAPGHLDQGHKGKAQVRKDLHHMSEIEDQISKHSLPMHVSLHLIVGMGTETGANTELGKANSKHHVLGNLNNPISDDPSESNDRSISSGEGDLYGPKLPPAESGNQDPGRSYPDSALGARQVTTDGRKKQVESRDLSATHRRRHRKCRDGRREGRSQEQVRHRKKESKSHSSKRSKDDERDRYEKKTCENEGTSRRKDKKDKKVKKKKKKHKHP